MGTLLWTSTYASRGLGRSVQLRMVKQILSHHHVLLRPCAGEAHWKTGIVERHIQTHKRVTEKLALDDIFYPDNGSVQQLIDHATTAKNIHGTKGGFPLTPG